MDYSLKQTGRAAMEFAGDFGGIGARVRAQVGAEMAARGRTEQTLGRYLQLASGLGIPAAYRYAVGTDAVEEADQLCRRIAEEFHGCMFFAGKVIFRREQWYQKLLHNETAYLIQKRLQWAGLTMVILPAKLR